MQGSLELCHIKKWSDLIIVFLRSGYHEQANYNLLMIFRSIWTKLKYTLNLVRCFLLHSDSTKFQYFFMDSKANCQIHMITDMFKNVWKEYFIKECFWSVRNILRVRFYRLAVTGVRSSRLNVIYTKFRRAIIAQLNKIWRVWACGRAIACHSRPGLYVRSIYVLCLRGRGTYLAKHCLFDRSCQSLKPPQKLLEINAKKI